MKGKYEPEGTTRSSVVSRLKAAYEKPQQDKAISPSPKPKGTSAASKVSSKKKAGGFLWGGGRRSNQGSLLRESIQEDEPSEIIIEEVFEEVVDEEVFEEVVEEVIEEVIEEPYSEPEALSSHHGRNNVMFEQLLMKAHGKEADQDEYEYDYEEVEEDTQRTNRGLMTFRTVSMSRRALFSKGNDDYNAIQQSFRDTHKSRRAAMMDLKTSTRHVATSIRAFDVKDEVEDDEEWEDQIIEKWFRRDVLPDDLSTACRELIPIVYKGQDVNPEVMIRRTPLPELYKYLKQHLDYKQMKANSNLNKFEEMFGASDDGGFEEEDPDEETVEIDDDLLYTGSKTHKTKASSSKKSTTSSNSNLSNEAKFESLLRQVHHEKEAEEVDDESEAEEEEYYEEEELEQGDLKKKNLALFEAMTGNYEEEVL
ncbi:MAG: hypothetical protein SGBAC_002257 [Bacillariaceae sp.]